MRPLLLLIDSLFRKIGVTDIIPDLALCKEEQDDKTRYEYHDMSSIAASYRQRSERLAAAGSTSASESALFGYFLSRGRESNNWRLQEKTK